MSYENRWEGEGLYRLYTNKITGKEVLESNLSIQGDSRFDNLRFIVNDFTDITEFEVSENDISKIVAIDNAAARSNANIKIAIVATNADLLEWIRLYSEKMENSSYKYIRIFDTIDEAYEWARQREKA